MTVICNSIEAGNYVVNTMQVYDGILDDSFFVQEALNEEIVKLEKDRQQERLYSHYQI